MSTPNEPQSPSMRERARAIYPSWLWVRTDPHRMLAFGLGSGLLRPASGTWGTLLAWAIWVLVPAMPDAAMAVLLVLTFAYGCWACERVGRELGVSDHVGMVWDEMGAFWLVLWLIPATLTAQALAFGLFRLFDIVKPPPIKYVDARLKGGFGVMFDDLLAAAYTLLVMAILLRTGVIA
ncbi:phosphatidylglycerophosphatase A [Pseudomonadota bacterium AL_CKDN230030165-1A_HGKHYDSX7]